MELNSNTPEIEPIEKEHANILSALLEVFTSPSKLFSKQFCKTAWITPLVIIVVVSLILGQFARPIFVKDMAPIIEANMEKYKDRLPPEQYAEMQKQVNQMKAEGELNEFKFTFVLAAVGFTLLIFLMITVLGQVTGNFMFAGKVTFWEIVNVVAFAALIGLLGDVVRSLLIISKGSMYVYTGLGMLKPVHDSSFVYYLLRQVDLFTVWRIVVTCVGLGALYKMKPAKFMYVIFPVWLLTIAMIAGANLFTGGSIIY